MAGKKSLRQKEGKITAQIVVLHSIYISCSNSSLLECSPATQATWVQLPAMTHVPRGAQLEDGENSVQVPPLEL
jgi:hypothetical protein